MGTVVIVMAAHLATRLRYDAALGQASIVSLGLHVVFVLVRLLLRFRDHAYKSTRGTYI